MVYLFVASFVHGKRSLDVAEDSVVSDAHHRLAAHSALPGVAVDHSCGVAGQDDLGVRVEVEQLPFERIRVRRDALVALRTRKVDHSSAWLDSGPCHLELQIELVALTIRSSLRAPGPKPKVDGGPAAAHGALIDVIVTG